jgi:hypothetical protein
MDWDLEGIVDRERAARAEGECRVFEVWLERLDDHLEGLGVGDESSAFRCYGSIIIFRA